MNSLKNSIAFHRLETMRNRLRFKNMVETSQVQADLLRQQAWLNHVNEVEKAHWQSVSFMRDIRDLIKDVVILQQVKQKKIKSNEEIPKEWTKEWVDLTEREVEELRHLIDWTAHWSYGTFAKAIQEKLKAKNSIKGTMNE
jgi:hypothetical protein